MGSAPEGIIEQLGKLLADPEESVRVQAVYALSCMGPRARVAQRWLQEACRDSNRRVREGAAAVLRVLEANRTATG